MIKLSYMEAAKILGVSAKPHQILFQGITIDSRKLAPNNLFAALKGEHVDGHDYLDEALQQGAAFALVDHPISSSLPQLIVPNVTEALGKLGAYWRNQFNLPIIAVTGSNGKTTLKNMIFSILKAACDDESEVLATEGNLNNHLGLPLTLARLNHKHRYAVIEMGMNHFGEIAYLTHLAHPTVAVITNAGAAHLEGVGNLEGVAKAKAEIFSNLTENGMAIINRDDAFYDYWRMQIGNHAFLSFGFHPDANITVVNEESSLIIKTPQDLISVNLPLLGKHNVMNALAATAAALAINIPTSAIKAGLQNVTPAKGRLQKHILENGVVIIDDTYNANPFSLQAAVETLSTFAGKKILVLGDMKELGEDAKKIHLTAGEKIRESGIDFLFTYGDLSAHTSYAFGEGAYHFNQQDKLVSALKPFLHNTTTILIKGSRSMQMEHVVHGLIQ